jgi:hypothetical protein
MEGRGATEGLGPEKKGGGGTHSTSHDGGEVAARQSSGRGRAAWRVREKARGEGLGRRSAWERCVGASWERCVGAAKGRRWRRQSCSGGEWRRPATASSCWRLGQRRSGVARSGKASRKGEAVGELGGDAWRPGAAGGPRAAWHGGQWRRCYAAEGE